VYLSASTTVSIQKQQQQQQQQQQRNSNSNNNNISCVNNRFTDADETTLVKINGKKKIASTYIALIETE